MSRQRTVNCKLACPDGKSRRVFLQKSDWDCGLACLRMVAKWYGIGPQRTRKAISASGGGPDKGTSQAGIGRGLRALGVAYRTVGAPTRSENWLDLDLCLQSKHPVVLCLDEDEHWVVFFRKARTRYYVYDPEVGMVWLSSRDLQVRWESTTGFFSFLRLRGTRSDS